MDEASHGERRSCRAALDGQPMAAVPTCARSRTLIYCALSRNSRLEEKQLRSSILGLVLSLLFVLSAPAQQTPTPAAKPLFTLQEVMIPVRDGVHLQTVILTPVDQAGPLPILFRRTPYGVPEKPPEQMPLRSRNSRKTATSL